jgi:hypothetical protein
MMNDTRVPPIESSNYRPDEPLRSWTSGESIAPFDAELIIQESNSFESVGRIIRGADLVDSDLISFGKLNSICVLRWYEPMISLVREPAIAPDVAEFLLKSIPGLSG